PSITATSPLAAAGLDSMLATLVAAEINKVHGVAITPMDVLDARDCRALLPTVVEQLAEELPVDDAEAALAQAVEEAVAPALTDGGRDRDMAVIGFSCALPGAADADGLWSLLCEGGSGVGPAPEFRWDGTPPVGGFLHDIEEFDARFFDFFPKQAEVLDPQARWLLRTAWEALESAGIAPTAAPRRTGVFVGASYQHYREYNVERELDAHSGLGNHNAFLANRISYFLDLRGPSMTIDTLCSSSLVALHTAVRSLRDGECDTAIVSGVRLAVSPLHYTAMRNLRALSPSGASRAFDNGADGFVPGEGVITLVLKPLRAARADHDRIHAVIKGTAVNHGGRTNGLTVPNSTAQHDVITDALRDADVHPDSISMLEAHGTGTPLGDPIEVDGLTRAWRRHTDRTQYCAIGSVKTNIGHLEPAAGLAGLAKVLLALRHDTIPPTLHVDRPNDHIRFEETPFYPAAAPIPWRRNGSPRRAAVSAFGMGGVNAHVIVEEPPVPAPRPPLHGHDHVLRVSAATEAGVRALALAYSVRLSGSSGPTETADLVHTANVGRAVLEFQTAVHGRTADALAAELRAVVDGIVPVVRIDREL
ncbi:beta-ketoacyl synthase N-terminal-like domain-containing protein, partial [Pseudonocardia abyssalis]